MERIEKDVRIGRREAMYFLGSVVAVGFLAVAHPGRFEAGRPQAVRHLPAQACVVFDQQHPLRQCPLL